MIDRLSAPEQQQIVEESINWESGLVNGEDNSATFARQPARKDEEENWGISDCGADIRYKLEIISYVIQIIFFQNPIF